MAVDLKVTVKLDGMKKIFKQLSSNKVKKEVGELVVEQMKEFIQAGVSPVRGGGRFRAYKDPKSYPGNLKAKRPVNLYLSGDMLDALTYKTGGSGKYGVRVGWFPGFYAGRKEADKAAAHNEGTKDMVARKMLPTKEGETFNVTIIRHIRYLYAFVISDILKR